MKSFISLTALSHFLAAIVLALFFVHQAGAVIIASDNFNGVNGAFINADSTVTGGPWVGSPGFTYGSGHLLSAATNTGGHVLGIDKGIGFFLSNPDLYELSADVFFNSASTNTRLYTVGFTAGNNTSAGANRNHLANITSTATLAGQPAIGLRADGVITVVEGNSTIFSGSLGGYVDDSTYAIRLRLDTTTVNWTVNASVYDYTNATETFLDLNGVAAGLTYTYATNPTIRYVGVSSNVNAADSANSYMDNFLFQTVVIPEPSTYAMLLGGIGLLGFLRRRSKS
jgi:hypothetical protein